MPADTTKGVSSRRTQKKLTEEEIQDIDRKRLRGELSCAECRRLKLRCDKKLPCGSCFRRGCESICPLGILAAGQGTRFILADTEQLHDKIYNMSNRIRQLEDALAILQSTVSDQRHPLLTDELLKVKFGSEALNRQSSPTDEDSATNKSIDALGTLTLGNLGEVQYFGRSAGSETLMMKAGEETENSSEDDEEGPQAPEEMLFEIDKLASLFPFSSRIRPNIDGLELIEAFLPSHERASQLCQLYMDQASYFFRPFLAEELMECLFPTVYNGVSTHRQAKSNGDPEDMVLGNEVKPHALATLYFVFALGALLDLTRMPYNSEAERYYDLGRAALSLRAVYDSPNMDSVQAMGLMATYHSLAGKKYSRDSAWCVMSFAAKLAQSIGLHRDSARWNMDSKTVQKRRNLFWEVFSADVSHSLALGRPPAIHLSYVDCEFPQDDDASLSSDAEHQSGFWRMKHTFAKDIYNSVAEATLTARSPSYNTILDLDRKVREISFPASFNPYVSKEVGLEIFHSSSLCLRDFYASQHRTVTMIYLHRSFFAQAMLDHPSNPLLSTFAPSFLTAYRSASIIIKASAHLFERCAAMAMRVWFLMYHTFSAAVIVGTVVTRSPNSNIASVAIREFNVAFGLFERTAAQSQRAKVALGVLVKLREQANRAYEQHSTGPTSPTESASSQVDIEDDLAIFGGQMRVLDKKGKKTHTRSPSAISVSSPSGGVFSGGSPKSTSTVSTSASPRVQTATLAPGLDQSGLGLNFPDVHPSLVAYLNQDAVRKVLGGRGLEQEQDASQSQYQDYRYAPQGQQLPTYLTGGRTSEEIDDGQEDRSGAPHLPPQSPTFSSQNQYLSFADPSRTWLTTDINYGDEYSQAGPSSQRQQVRGLAFGFNVPPGSVPGYDFQSGFSQQPNSSNSRLGTPQQYNSAGDSEYAVYGYSGGQSIFYEDTGRPVLNRGGDGAAIGNDYALNRGTSSMDRAGVIDMGLSSEGGIDAGWVSFMRDCGIMDTDG